LDGGIGNQAGVGLGTASENDDLVHLFEELRIDADFVQRQLAVEIRTPQKSLGDGGGLVGVFLSHEGAEAPLFGRSRVPVNVVFLAFSGSAEEVGDLHGVRGDGDDLVLAEFHGATRVVDEAGDVRAEEVFAVAT